MSLCAVPCQTGLEAALNRNERFKELQKFCSAHEENKFPKETFRNKGNDHCNLQKLRLNKNKQFAKLFQVDNFFNGIYIILKRACKIIVVFEEFSPSQKKLNFKP